MRSLNNKSESHFNYSITGGNYTFYNGNHSRPTFLEELLGNLTALFEGYSPKNITLFNETCRNYWDHTPNEQCLLTIARSKNYNLGVAVMATANETHHRWELLHNRAPQFLETMPDNITATYKMDLLKTINLTEYVWDDESTSQLKYRVGTDLPTNEFTLENGVFTWNVSTGFRYIDTSFTFFVIDSLNASGSHVVTVQYCGCEDPSECNFDTQNANSSGKVIKARCVCPDYFTGLYCETELDPCTDYNCFQNCSTALNRSSLSWPCAPCPKGRYDVTVLNEQDCKNVNECAPGYGGEDKCQQNCHDTDGSFSCSCRSGYTLNADNHTCDDINECIDTHKCSQTEICINTAGGYKCNCAPGYSRQIDNGSCIQTGRLMLEDTVDVKCSTSQWDITIHMDMLKSIYPGVTSRDIYLGQTQCHGRLESSTLNFQYSVNACATTEKTSGITKVYNNKLFYAVFDPIIPFLIRRHVWTFSVECDVIRGGTGTSHLHHGTETHHATFVNHFNVSVELFTDQNFLHLLSGDSHTVHVGEDVYVKVSSSIPDWNTKMRLHSCFTRPNRNATTDMEVTLIKNG